MVELSDNRQSAGHEVIGRLSALLPLIIFAQQCVQAVNNIDNRSTFISWEWAPAIGVNLDFAIDGLSQLFALIISGVGFFVVLFSVDYMKGHRQYGRFFVFLHLFLLAMLGLVFADNLITLFVFWELTTVLSYLLIGFEHGNAASRKYARQALLVTGAGGLVLLIGFLMIGALTGTYRLSALAEARQMIQHHDWYVPILAAVLIGAFTKSAQFPFHFWLPNAMAAPTPISAFLHSATMVKAGIYLLARFHPVIGGTDLWMGTLVLVGGTTALLGAVLALGQTDLKRMLAYTTIMALGMLTMFLGGQTTPALTAAITFLLVHALYKSALFMVVGAVDHATGTRDLERLGGLLRSMPWTAFGTATAAMSMAGFPLFLGFIGKEIMYKGALTEEMFPVFATTAAVTANALMTSAAGLIAIRPFLGRPRSTPKKPHEAPVGMWAGPFMIGSLGLIFGIIPEWVGRWLVQPAVSAFHPSVEQIRLNLFHGFNEPLLLSLLTLLLGSIVYLVRRPLRRWLARVDADMPLSGNAAYELAMATTARLASTVTGILQNGSLHRYLLVIVGTFTLTTAGIWWINFHGLPGPLRWPSLTLTMWLLMVLMAAAVAAVVMARSRILAVSALGIVGGGAALVFLVYGAPDLALTQLLVETLTLIIVSIVLLRLPALNGTPVTRLRSRWLDGLLAVGIGTLVAALSMTTATGNIDRQLTSFFEQSSYIAAHGRNIVNVILVDFRALDTLGEITVVATAGLAGYALIVGRRK